MTKVHQALNKLLVLTVISICLYRLGSSPYWRSIVTINVDEKSDAKDSKWLFFQARLHLALKNNQ